MAERPVALVGLVLLLVAAGMGLGWGLGSLTGTPSALDRGLDTAAMNHLAAENSGARSFQSPPQSAPTPVVVPELGQSTPKAEFKYEEDYGPTIVPPQPLVAGQGLSGVRLSDPLAATQPSTQPVVPVAPTIPVSPTNNGAEGDLSPPQSPPPQQAAVIQKGWKDSAVPPPSGAGKRPMIAIVIDDMGLDKGRSARIVDLPGPLTTSYLTYASDLRKQAAGARQAGHEVMMHVPMQPKGSIDAGPDVLRVGMGEEEIRSRITEYLGRLDGIVGINNHMGSAFTEHAEGLRPVMQALKARGLFFLDSKTSGRSVGTRVAQEVGVPAIDRNVFLDHEETAGFVRAQLAETEAIARKHGYAVAIGHPKDVTISGLRQWLPTLAEKGLVLVPLSTLVGLRHDQG